MPEISVITPTWNRRALLLEAVASVRAQTFQDWELIVVDDGSTDGTAEAIGALGDSRIRLLPRPQTGNVAELRNAGMTVARSDLIAFLDSDDLWHERKLEVQLAATLAAAVQWSYTGFSLIDLLGRSLPIRGGSFRPISGSILRDLITTQAALVISSVMVARPLLDAVGGFDSESGREDYDLMLRLAALAPVHAIDETLVHVREHPGRTTSAMRTSHELSLVPYLNLLGRERDPQLRRLARRRCAELLIHGAVHAAEDRDPRRAVRLLVRSLRYQPAPGLWARAIAAMTVRLLRIRL